MGNYDDLAAEFKANLEARKGGEEARDYRRIG